jgi:hypothetical protein
MAKISLTQVKSKFESGDRPTGADYVDLIDTLAAQSTDLGTAGSNESSENTVSGIENPTTIDSFSATEWRMVKYVVSISNISSGVNKTYSTELTILIDNDNVNVSQYGMIDNNGDIGTVDVSKSAGQILLRVLPHSALMPVTARFYRTGLKA